MKKKIIAAFLISAMAVGMTACSSNSTASSTAASSDGQSASAAEESSASHIGTEPGGSLDSEDLENLESIEIEGAEKLENGTVQWLSFWDINPVNGKAYPTELELFERLYGGKIEYIRTTFETRYEDLAKLVASSDAPDMFPAADMDGFPKCAKNGLFAPLDDYVDYSSDLWSGVKSANDNFIFGDKHYVAVTSTDAGVVMIYNIRVIEENNLDDPFELSKEGNWTWSALNDMMAKFCDPDNDKYAIDGWWFEFALSNTTGVPYISMENGKAVSNLADPLIEYAQNYMENMRKNEYPYPKWENSWTINPVNISNGKTLFYPCGIWCLYEADLTNFGEQGEIGFAPMPKCDKADAHYLPSGLDAFAMVSGGKNPEGVGAFLNCRRFAAQDQTTHDIALKQYKEDYGWTDEMCDMLDFTQKLTAEHPVFDFYGGISEDLYDTLNNPCKESFNNAVSWTQTRESISPTVQHELDKFNSATE